MTELLLAWNWPGLGPLARGPLAWPWPLAYSIYLNLAWPVALGPWPGPGPGLKYLFGFGLALALAYNIYLDLAWPWPWPWPEILRLIGLQRPNG